LNNFLKKFTIGEEKEDLQAVITAISNGVVFRGTNLWILIFAIFVASLGLNVNSTAVIIGAMLISPLMGPIMGIGLSMGISDLPLLRKSLSNYGIATLVALATSTLYFFISPLNEAHSEILARTSPTIYDVLIALFGGLAGIVATLSKHKGNVIPGVAIATALMPPLCTAGYGLATWQFSFFTGAFYLYIINTVFIALATLIIVRFFHFPYKQPVKSKTGRIALRIIWAVVLITLLPSIWFGYEMIQQNRFNAKANQFINAEAHFPGDYLLSKKINAAGKKITLVFGGEKITEDEIVSLNKKLPLYKLSSAQLEIKQGFASLSENNLDQKNEQVQQLTDALKIAESKNQQLKRKVDSVLALQKLSAQVFSEIKAQYATVQSAVIQPSLLHTDSLTIVTTLVLLNVTRGFPLSEKAKLENWLKVRLGHPSVHLIIQK